MKFSKCLAVSLLLSICSAATADEQDTNSLQDARAIEVLNSMVAYSGSLEQFEISGEVAQDARLGAGLIVSNPSEIMIRVDRPNALHVSKFDGIDTQHIYLNDGRLTVFGTHTNFYANAMVPKDIEEGLQFALDKLDVEAPLAELVFASAAKEMLMDGAEAIYLTNKSRIGGVDCHQIVVRGAETDVQLWIQEGSKPVPKRMQLTMKWDNGSPRLTATLNWKTVDNFKSGVFEFKPPEGAQEIKFMGDEK